MSSEQINTIVYFSMISDDIFKLNGIGHEDFHYRKGEHYQKISAIDSLHFVCRGRGHLFIGRKEYAISAGDFFFIEKHVPLTYYPDEADPWEYFWIDVKPVSLFKLSELIALNASCPVRHAKCPEAVEPLFRDLFAADISRIARYYATISVLTRIISLEDVALSTIRDITAEEALVRRVKELITQNYTTVGFSIEDIADHLQVTSRHIRRAFQHCVGMTPIEYITLYRLNTARNLLAYRDYKVEELCTEVGWRDPRYFMRCFKQKYAMTVQEYRKGVVDGYRSLRSSAPNQ